MKVIDLNTIREVHKYSGTSVKTLVMLHNAGIPIVKGPRGIHDTPSWLDKLLADNEELDEQTAPS